MERPACEYFGMTFTFRLLGCHALFERKKLARMYAAFQAVSIRF
jgi:hypothetical protein